MALAILLSHPQITLKAENNIKSQFAALPTSLPTIIRVWSISALVLLSDVVKMETPNVELNG